MKRKMHISETKSNSKQCVVSLNQPAVTLKLFGFISAVKEAALEELHSHHSKDEHEE